MIETRHVPRRHDTNRRRRHAILFLVCQVNKLGVMLFVLRVMHRVGMSLTPTCFMSNCCMYTTVPAKSNANINSNTRFFWPAVTEINNENQRHFPSYIFCFPQTPPPRVFLSREIALLPPLRGIAQTETGLSAMPCKRSSA